MDGGDLVAWALTAAVSRPPVSHMPVASAVGLCAWVVPGLDPGVGVARSMRQGESLAGQMGERLGATSSAPLQPGGVSWCTQFRSEPRWIPAVQEWGLIWHCLTGTHTFLKARHRGDGVTSQHPRKMTLTQCCAATTSVPFPAFLLLPSPPLDFLEGISEAERWRKICCPQLHSPGEPSSQGWAGLG